MTEDERIKKWLDQKLAETKRHGFVFGLSGGVDSSVVGVLCREVSNQTLGLYMPIHPTNDDDWDDIIEFSVKFDIPVKTIKLQVTFNEARQAMEMGDRMYGFVPDANIKARLRMLTLYFHANILDYLVVGTTNRSESELGYFTKYGDGGVDIEPISHLLKYQVYDLARHKKLPESIINKAPSAGLWEGQTDENDIGFSYDEIDGHLDGWTFVPKIERLRERNQHKLFPPDCLKPHWWEKRR